MKIETIAHKALRRLAETESARGLPPELADRLAKMLVFLEAVAGPDELLRTPNYGAHRLTGDRAGTWALVASRNWRMTFRLDDSGAIIDLDLEDYH